MGGGSVIAILALGVVLTYKASGTVNFAHAALGMYVAFAFYELRATGELVLPLLGLPDRVAIVDRPTVFTAMVTCLALAAALGALIYGLVFRPLRRAPALARVVASLGLLLYFIALIDLRFGARGATALVIRNVLDATVVDFAGASVPLDRFLLLAVALVLTGVLWLAYRYTRFGLATRATAEHEEGAIQIGLSPDAYGVANWALASMLAALAIILAAPVVRLDPAGTSLLIVPAVAAALVARFNSFVVATAVGLAIGMAQSEILNLQADHAWLPEIGLQQGVPFLVILLTLLVGGSRLPHRGRPPTRSLPESPDPRWTGVGVLVVGGIAVSGLLVLDGDWRLGIIISTITAVLALSVVVVTGFVGQISLAPYAFAGVAAFAMVRFANDAGFGFPFDALAGAAVATTVGVLVAIPAVRVRGLDLAIATLAAAVVIEELIFKWTWFTGGAAGSRVPPPELFGIDVGIAARGTDYPRAAFGIVCIVVLVVCTLAVVGLRRGATGRAWLAVRADERAAAAAGINVVGAKISAFGVSAFLAGIGGTLLAYERQILSPSSFAVLASLTLLAFTYLSGIAAPAGALLAGVLASGGILTVALDRIDDGASRYQLATAGLALVAAAVLFPNGIVGSLARIRRR